MGDVVVLYGDFFFELVMVIFLGGVLGMVSILEKICMEVIVLDGIISGEIIVSINFGMIILDFFFCDDCNVIVNFDDM